ncbi:MAG: hypothetical protein PHT07_02145 [Paludibacter sp.]|nr:hypothetical protein [Paludibacter sp.]
METEQAVNRQPVLFLLTTYYKQPTSKRDGFQGEVFYKIEN